MEVQSCAHVTCMALRIALLGWLPGIEGLMGPLTVSETPAACIFNCAVLVRCNVPFLYAVVWRSNTCLTTQRRAKGR